MDCSGRGRHGSRVERRCNIEDDQGGKLIATNGAANKGFSGRPSVAAGGPRRPSGVQTVREGQWYAMTVRNVLSSLERYRRTLTKRAM